MPKLPWMQFYPSDWLLDTQLLTPATRGIWMDIICYMWRAEPRGILSCNVVDLAQLLRCTCQQLSTALAEFELRNICLIERENDNVTLRCRRICREEKSRISVKLRVKKHRELVSNASVTQDSNATVQTLVTGENQNHISESEVRSQNQKKNTLSPAGKPAVREKGKVAFPQEWKPSHEELEQWRQHGITNPAMEFASFRDHALANDRRCKDWPAAWRNWCRKHLRDREEGRKSWTA